MTDKYIASLLSSVKGWNTGVNLPIADDSNKNLAELLEKKQKAILELQKSRETVTKRIENVTKELESQSIVLTNKRKIAGSIQSSIVHEKNRILITDKHVELLQKECRKSKKEFKDVESRRTMFMREYVKRKLIVDNLTLELKYNEETLNGFMSSTSENDQELNFLRNFWDSDRKDAEKTQRKLKKLIEERLKLQNKLETAITRTTQIEGQYQKLTHQFKRVHNERNQAVENWKQVLNSLKKRDSFLQNCASKYTIIRKSVAHITYQIEEKQNYLAETCKGHSELQLSVEQSEKNIATTQYAINSMKYMLSDYKNTRSAQKSIIDQITSRLKPLFNQIEKTRAQAYEVHKHLETISYEVEQLRDYAIAIKTDSSSSHNIIEEMTRMIDEQEKEYEQKVNRLEKIRILQFENLNILNEVKKEFKDVEYHIFSGRNRFKNLKNECRSEELVLIKRKQECYKVELIYMGFKQKLSRLLSPDDQEFQASFDNESKELQKAIKDLKKDYEFIMKQRKFLEIQKSHVLSIVARISQEISDSLFEQQNLNTEIKTGLILAKRLQDTQKLFTTEVQNLKVDHSIATFEKGKLKQMIKESKESVLTLDQYRQELKTDAEIRRAYIKSHKNLLELHKRKLLQIKSSLIKNIHEVDGAINVWKIKYEYLLCGSEESEKEYQGEAKMILKNAQEKVFIQRECLLWEARIKEAEMELIGLQNNLSVVLNSNHLFKNTLMPAPDKSPEMEGLLKLQTRYRDLIIRKKKILIKLEEITKLYEAKERRLSGLQSYGHVLSESLIKMDLERNAIMKDIMNQKVKIHRAQLLSQRCIKCLDNVEEEEKKLFEAYLHAKATVEKFNFAIQYLSRAISQNTELWEPTYEFLAQIHGFSKVIKELHQAVESKASLLPKLSKSTSDVATIYKKNMPLRLFERSSGMVTGGGGPNRSASVAGTPYRMATMDILMAKEMYLHREVTIMEQQDQMAHHKSVLTLRHLAKHKRRELDPLQRGVTYGDLIQEAYTRPIEIGEQERSAKKTVIRKRLKSIARIRKIEQRKINQK